MSKVIQLKNELNTQEEDAKKAAESIYENTPLTDEERATLDKLKEEKRVVVVEESNGAQVEIALDKYLTGLDSKITNLNDSNIKLLSSRIMTEKDEVLKSSRKELVQRVAKETGIKMDEESVDNLTEKVEAALKTLLNVEKVDVNRTIPLLAKKRVEQILEAMPEEFDVFLDKNLIKVNQAKAKQQILTAIQMLITIGPELDTLNEYIEDEHKKMEVMLKLNEASMDFYQMLKDERVFSDIIKDVLKSSNELNNTYKKYTTNPDAINNVYRQKAIVNGKLVEAYERLISEATDPVHIDKIQAEIDSCKQMAEAYTNVLELRRFKIEAESFLKNFDVKKRYKKIYDLEKAAFEVIELINKHRLRLPFPGFNGKDSQLQSLHISYRNFFESIVAYFNAVVEKATENGDAAIQPIKVDAKVFGWIILVIMGRMIKKIGKSDNPIDGFELHTTFEMLCRLGGEMFMMDKLHQTILPILNELEIKK